MAGWRLTVATRPASRGITEVRGGRRLCCCGSDGSKRVLCADKTGTVPQTGRGTLSRVLALRRLCQQVLPCSWKGRCGQRISAALVVQRGEGTMVLLSPALGVSRARLAGGAY